MQYFYFQTNYPGVYVRCGKNGSQAEVVTERDLPREGLTAFKGCQLSPDMRRVLMESCMGARVDTSQYATAQS